MKGAVMKGHSEEGAQEGLPQVEVLCARVEAVWCRPSNSPPARWKRVGFAVSSLHPIKLLAF